MSSKKDREPRDEFDVVRLPAFLEKPISRLNNKPTQIPQPAPREDDAPYVYTDEDSEPGEQQPQRPSQQGPRKWYSGARGKTLIYGAGMVVMAIMQFRN